MKIIMILVSAIINTIIIFWKFRQHIDLKTKLPKFSKTVKTETTLLTLELTNRTTPSQTSIKECQQKLNFQTSIEWESIKLWAKTKTQQKKIIKVQQLRYYTKCKTHVKLTTEVKERKSKTTNNLTNYAMQFLQSVARTTRNNKNE